MIPVQFRPAADRDVVEAVGWYESQFPGVGSRFFEDLDRVLSRVEEPVVNFLMCIGMRIVLCYGNSLLASFSRIMRIERSLLQSPIYVENLGDGKNAFDA